MKRSEQIYEALKKEIVECKLPPGSALSELELSQRIGGSRTPIRESLQQLSREGLVRIVPRRGAFVAEIAISDVHELFQMRSILETAAARLASHAPDRRSLEALVPKFHASRDSLRAGRHQEYYEVIRCFDVEVARLTLNRRLQQALEETWTQVRRIRHIAAANQERMQATIDEHLEILQAISDGREEDAANSTALHVARSLQNVLSTMSAGMQIIPTTPDQEASA